MKMFILTKEVCSDSMIVCHCITLIVVEVPGNVLFEQLVPVHGQTRQTTATGQKISLQWRSRLCVLVSNV